MNTPGLTGGSFLSTNISCGPLTFVIAERHQVLREALTFYFARETRFEILGQAGDGNKTVELCFRLKPKLLLLSAALSGLSSVEVCRTLSAAGIGINILVMVGACDDEMILRHVEAGAVGMVETTGSLPALVQAAEVVGRGRAFFGERVTQVVRDALRGFGGRARTGEISLRESEVLRLIAEGFSNKEIAAQLGICAKTVENHRSHLMRKLRAHNGADLTREAFRLGVVKQTELSSTPFFTLDT